MIQGKNYPPLMGGFFSRGGKFTPPSFKKTSPPPQIRPWWCDFEVLLDIKTWKLCVFLCINIFSVLYLLLTNLISRNLHLRIKNDYSYWSSSAFFPNDKEKFCWVRLLFQMCIYEYLTLFLTRKFSSTSSIGSIRKKDWATPTLPAGIGLKDFCLWKHL